MAGCRASWSIVDEAALNVRIPAYVSRNAGGRRFGPGRPGQGPGQAGGDAADPNARRKDQLDRIKELFKKALAYDAVVRGADERGDSPPAPDPRLEAMVPYARGVKPVIFHAEQQVEILDALDMARELKLKAVISGGAEAWKVVEALQKSKVPVLLGGTLRLPRKEYDPYDSAYATPAKLHAAGVTFAIRSQSGGPSDATATRNLPYEAAAAVAFGLPEDAAIQSVTIAPARILGVADQVGSIEPGKRANLVITAGHILQPTTSVAGAVHRRTADPPGKPAHAALRQVSPASGRGASRTRAHGDRAGLGQRDRPSRNEGHPEQRLRIPAGRVSGGSRRDSLRRGPPEWLTTTCAVTCRRVADQVLVGCAGSSADAAVRGPEAGEWRRYESSTRPNWSAWWVRLMYSLTPMRKSVVA